MDANKRESWDEPRNGEIQPQMNQPSREAMAGKLQIDADKGIEKNREWTRMDTNDFPTDQLAL